MARTLTPRSKEMWLAAYFLARFSRDGKTPEVLGPATWTEIYKRMYEVAGGGRPFSTFKGSMEPLRKVLNWHFQNGGPFHVTNTGEIATLEFGPLAEYAREMDQVSDQDVFKLVYEKFPLFKIWNQSDERLTAAILRMVTQEQIDRAVIRAMAGGTAPGFGGSTGYDLIAPDETRLAPESVFALALGEAMGVLPTPNQFSGGYSHLAFQLLESAGYPILAKDDPVNQRWLLAVDDDLVFAEGSPALRTHLQRERKPALSSAKKRRMKEELGYLECERCNLKASEQGLHGEAVIEVHHASTMVAEMEPSHLTRLADLQCLCANCHRIVHRELATRVHS